MEAFNVEGKIHSVLLNKTLSFKSFKVWAKFNLVFVVFF